MNSPQHKFDGTREPPVVIYDPQHRPDVDPGLFRGLAFGLPLSAALWALIILFVSWLRS